MLGGYHNFMIPVKSSFHKTIYKRFNFHLYPLKFMLGKGIKKYLTSSQYAESQNFENNQFSFVGSHKPCITY
jgi:hypothetical protein